MTLLLMCIFIIPTFLGSIYLSDYNSDANQLYYCHDCKKYTRGYIILLEYLKFLTEKANNGKQISKVYFSCRGECPHCRESYSVFESHEKHPWLKTHPDCKEINNFQLIFFIIRTKKTIKILNKIYDLQEYRKYNKF